MNTILPFAMFKNVGIIDVDAIRTVLTMFVDVVYAVSSWSIVNFNDLNSSCYPTHHKINHQTGIMYLGESSMKVFKLIVRGARASALLAPKIHLPTLEPSTCRNVRWFTH